MRSIATACGYETDLASIPSVIHVGPSVGLGAQAWEVGEAAARALRIRENLGDGPLSDEALAALAGTSQAILTPDSERAPFSFALSDHGTTTKLILHSPIPTNRRFALARLVGDLVCHTRREALVPALRAFTYRQKVQRAFAAELLCPFEEARNRLDDDLSDENQERVAADYRVSPILVRTQLVNKKLLGHDVLIYP